MQRGVFRAVCFLLCVVAFLACLLQVVVSGIVINMSFDCTAGRSSSCSDFADNASKATVTSDLAGFAVVSAAIGFALVFATLFNMANVTSDTKDAVNGVMFLSAAFAILAFSFGIKQASVDSDLLDKDLAATIAITAIISVILPGLFFAVFFAAPLTAPKVNSILTKRGSAIIIGGVSLAVNLVLVLIRLGTAGDVYETYADCAFGNHAACNRIKSDFIFTTRFTAHNALLSGMFILGALVMHGLHLRSPSLQSEASSFAAYLQAFFVNLVASCFAARELHNHTVSSSPITLAGTTIVQAVVLVLPLVVLRPSRLRITAHSAMVWVYVILLVIAGFFYVCRLSIGASLMDDVIDCQLGSAKDCLTVIQEVNEVSGALTSQTFLSGTVGIAALVALMIHLHVWDWCTHRSVVVVLWIALLVDLVSFFYAIKHVRHRTTALEFLENDHALFFQFRVRQYGFNHINDVGSSDRSTAIAGLSVVQPFLTAFLLLAVALERKYLPDSPSTKAVELGQK